MPISTTQATTKITKKPTTISEVQEPKLIRRYCQAEDENDTNLDNFTLINAGVKAKSKADQWLKLNTECMLKQAENEGRYNFFDKIFMNNVKFSKPLPIRIEIENA